MLTFDDGPWPENAVLKSLANECDRNFLFDRQTRDVSKSLKQVAAAYTIGTHLVARNAHQQAH